MSDDLSGDAIRKKREHVKVTYPDQYAGAPKFAQTMAESSDTNPKKH